MQSRKSTVKFGIITSSLGQKKKAIQQQGVSYVSIELQRDVADLDCAVKPQKIPLLGCGKV